MFVKWVHKTCIIISGPPSSLLYNCDILVSVWSIFLINRLADNCLAEDDNILIIFGDDANRGVKAPCERFSLLA